jgi:hypothetical protein
MGIGLQGGGGDLTRICDGTRVDLTLTFYLRAVRQCHYQVSAI